MTTVPSSPADRSDGAEDSPCDCEVEAALHPSSADEGSTTSESLSALPAVAHVSVSSILLGGGPRFARDAFGPVLAFYLVWKLWAIVPGIVAATLVSVVAYHYERRRDRTGAVARLSLGFVLVQALIGVVSNSATVYLAQPVLLSGALGLAFLVSAAIGRPLAGVFAQEFYVFPEEVRTSKTFRHIFGTVSFAWGAYQLSRSIIRFVALTAGSVEAFLVVNVVTGIPFTLALMTWSVWYSVRGFRRSEEWGWAFDDEPSPTS